MRGPITTHILMAMAWPMALARPVRPMPVARQRVVPALVVGTMARPVAAHWWLKGEAVGGVSRRGP
jgi:hypothetical protein